MLRIGFLPSDFNPMILMLGEADDLRCLAGVLRQFAHTGGPVRLETLPFCAARTRVTLSEGEAACGVHAAGPEHFVWRLSRTQAGDFAERVEALALPARLAGSEVLSCNSGEEVPVKVSRGEYTEDFLLAR